MTGPASKERAVSNVPIRIELSEVGQRTRVWVRDVEVSRFLRRIIVDAEVGHLTVVTLEAIQVEGQIDGLAGILTILSAAPEEAVSGVKPEPPVISSDGKS